MTDRELDDALNSWSAPAAPAAMRTRLQRDVEAAERRMPLLSRRGFQWGLGAAAVAACVGAAEIRTASLGTFSTGWQDADGEIYLQIEHRADPPIAPFRAMRLGGGGSAGGSEALQHGASFVHDGSQGVYYAYGYTLQRLGGGKYQASFSTLDAAAWKRLATPFRREGPLESPPTLPPPQVVTVGQPFEVTLAENGGERIYDRLTLSWTAPQAPAAAVPDAMRLNRAKLYIDGALIAEDASKSSGGTVWFHLPGEGRYLIALDPRQNALFQQAGTVEGNTVEFQMDGRRFRLVSSAAIASGGRRAVFVYHQRSFEQNLDSGSAIAGKVFMGSAGPAQLHQ